jgi:hypothetical protein
MPIDSLAVNGSVINLSPKELAERWQMREATLERWRSERVLYRHVVI